MKELFGTSTETRDPDAPSDLQLDRYIRGELTGEAHGAIEQAIAASDDTRERYQALKAGFPAAVDADALWRRIDAATPETDDAPAPKPGFRWLRLLWSPPVLAGLVAAVATFVIVDQTGGPAEPMGPDGIRSKGALSLALFRQTPTGSESLIYGADVSAGTAIRYAVDIPADGHLMIIDEDPAGALSVAHPQRHPNDRSAVAVKGGRGQLLDTAVALDDAVGDEWLHVVWCPNGFGLSGLRAGENPGELEIPDGCETTAFLIRKVSE